MATQTSNVKSSVKVKSSVEVFTTKISDYTYTESSGNATITAYSGSGGNVKLPSILGGYPIIGVAASAMASKSLTALIIPSGYTTIGNTAFNNNANLKVILDANITTGGTTPFSNCSIGDNLTITNNVTSIPDNLFRSCGLTSVNIPSSVTSVGWHSFRSNSIKELSINHTFSLGFMTFGSNANLKLTLNANITTGGTTPFDSCSLGDNLVIGSNCTSIPAQLLTGCGLTSLYIPSNVETLAQACFFNNPNLKVTLDANIKSGNLYPFLNCSLGDNLIITKNVTSIPTNTFRECGLTSVNIPSNVTSVGFSSFRANANLAIVRIYNAEMTYSTLVLDGNMTTENKGIIYGYNDSTAKTLAGIYSTTYNFVAIKTQTSNVTSSVNIKSYAEIKREKEQTENVKSSVNVNSSVETSKKKTIANIDSVNVGSSISLVKIITNTASINVGSSVTQTHVYGVEHDVMWEVQVALYDQLKENLTLMQLIENRIYDAVPTNEVYPYLKIGDCVGVDDDTHCNEGYSLIKDFQIYTKPYGLGFYPAMTIFEQLNNSLNCKKLSMSNFNMIICVLDNMTTIEDSDKNIINARYKILCDTKLNRG